MMVEARRSTVQIKQMGKLKTWVGYVILKSCGKHITLEKDNTDIKPLRR